MPEFKPGDRVRYLWEDGFAGKITDRCWMSDSIPNPWSMTPPDGVVVQVTHAPDPPTSNTSTDR